MNVLLLLGTRGSWVAAKCKYGTRDTVTVRATSRRLALVGRRVTATAATAGGGLGILHMSLACGGKALRMELLLLLLLLLGRG